MTERHLKSVGCQGVGSATLSIKSVEFSANSSRQQSDHHWTADARHPAEHPLRASTIRRSRPRTRSITSTAQIGSRFRATISSAIGMLSNLPYSSLETVTKAKPLMRARPRRNPRAEGDVPQVAGFLVDLNKKPATAVDGVKCIVGTCPRQMRHRKLVGHDPIRFHVNDDALGKWNGQCQPSATSVWPTAVTDVRFSVKHPETVGLVTTVLADELGNEAWLPDWAEAVHLVDCRRAQKLVETQKVQGDHRGQFMDVDVARNKRPARHQRQIEPFLRHHSLGRMFSNRQIWTRDAKPAGRCSPTKRPSHG